MQEKIKKKCDEIRDLLVEKNEAYGNAVFERGVLFDVEPIYAIQARINDKLNRLKNNTVYQSDNDLLDLTGYLILLQIMKEDMDANIEWGFDNNVKGKSNEVHNQITEKIDFLFIDGDHSYKGVLDDFNNFKDKVNVNGYICFDNYNDPSWSEVKIACDVAIKDNDFEIIDERKYCLTLRKLK